MWSTSKEKKESNKIATQFVMTVAVVYILLGALLLFVPQIQIITLSYLICSLLIITGIVLIVRYFITDAYKNINEYGFSIGVFMVILGMCALVRVEQVADSFIICLGIALLMTSVIKLQNALDLKNLEQKTWIVMLGIALLFVVCSIIVIINPFRQPQTLPDFTYRILMIDGVVSLLSNLYLFIIIKKSNKESSKESDKESNKEINATNDQNPLKEEERKEEKADPIDEQDQLKEEL